MKSWFLDFNDAKTTECTLVEGASKAALGLGVRERMGKEAREPFAEITAVLIRGDE